MGTVNSWIRRYIFIHSSDQKRSFLLSDLDPILLVEDNANDAELTIKGLTEAGLGNRIVHVYDGVEALEYLRGEGAFTGKPGAMPVVAIVDIKMPRMDGIELLAAIRADEALKRLPVVMLTSSREDADIMRTYQLGTNAFVVKPVRFAEFTAAVRSIGLFWGVLNERAPG